MMQITLNGKVKNFEETLSLKSIILQFCRDTEHVIAEVNGQIVKSQKWNEQSIKNGDKIELINFVGGG